jgi:hypothetical protein
LRPKTIEANCGAAGPPHGGGRRRRTGRRRQSLEQGRSPPGFSLKDQLAEVWTERLKGTATRRRPTDPLLLGQLWLIYTPPQKKDD